MNDATRAEVREWLAISRRDLEAARALALHGKAFREIVLYHCQQCAEKAVKGFLTFYQIKFPKTHDVALLLRLAGDVEDSYLHWEDQAEALTDYATAYRYPGVELEPDQELVEEAMDDADAIYRHVMSHLGDEFGPGQVELS